jgi:hypothetical protein
MEKSARIYPVSLPGATVVHNKIFFYCSKSIQCIFRYKLSNIEYVSYIKCTNVDGNVRENKTNYLWLQVVEIEEETSLNSSILVHNPMALGLVGSRKQKVNDQVPNSTFNNE